MHLGRKMPPTRRSEGILIEQVGDETVVYDERTKEAHCLNPLAAAVFEHCDGRRSPDELAIAVSESLDEPVDAARVADTLAQLEERDLVTAPRGGVSRRDMLRRSAVAGAVAAATPAIVTILAPTAYAATTPTCGDILCCACNPGSEVGQPCCIHPTAFQCNCTAKESGASCKQCKPQGAASTDVRCANFFPGSGGFPPNHDAVCPCEFEEVGCVP